MDDRDAPRPPSPRTHRIFVCPSRYGPRVDLPFWVTIVSTLAGVVIAGGFGHWTGVRSAAIAAKESQADRELERDRLAHERLMRQDARLDRAWELCQSPRGANWQAGVALLAVLLTEPDLTPQVKRYIEALIAIEYRGRIQEVREAGQAGSVDIYYELGDDGSQEGDADER